MDGATTGQKPPSTKAATAIKVEDPAILRPDFYQTTKAGGERQRLALACQTCRQKKVKCNGELPKCHRCTNLGLECEYKLTTHRRSRNSAVTKGRSDGPVQDQELSYEVANTDHDRHDWHPTQPPMQPAFKRPRSMTGSPTTTTTTAGMRQIPERKMTNSPPEPTHMRDYPRSGPINSTKQRPQKQSHSNVVPDPTKRYELPAPLPSHRLAIELCQVYFSRIYGQMYAFLHPPTFMRSVVETPQLIPPALLLAICAISARFHLSASPGSLKPDVWASSCLDTIFGSGHMPVDARTRAPDMHNLMPHTRSHFFRPSLSSVQALHLIAYHYFGEGQSSIAWLLAGFGLRMAESLHLNREVFDDPIGSSDDPSLKYAVSFRHREMRRRTFWALYIMDRLSSAGVHRPFSIRNDDIAIQLPVKQECYDREIPSYTSLLNHSINPDQLAGIDCTGYMIRIIDVWGEVSRFVQQSASELNWNTGSPLMSLRQRILMWEENLPHSLKFTSSNVRQQSPAWYIMHAAYFLSLCVMHRFALPKSETRQYGVDHIPVPYLNMCVKEAVHNACRVSEIIQMIPSSTKISAPFMGFAAFSAATIHAFLGFHVPEMDSMLVSAHRGYVHSTLVFLSTLAEAWKPLSKMHDALTSQVNNRPRSDRSNGSSILNESAANQFKIPDSLPVKFNSQQQIEMNTLAFSTWFDDPITASKLHAASWDAQYQPPPPQMHHHDHAAFPSNNPVLGYDSKLGTITQAHHHGDLLPPQLTEASSSSDKSIRTRVRTPSASDAPYGEAFPIVASEYNSDSDDVVADLLVSLNHQADEAKQQPPPYPPFTQDAALEEDFLDHLNNVRETTNRMSATIDCLQLMKVGVITPQNWM